MYVLSTYLALSSHFQPPKKQHTNARVGKKKVEETRTRDSVSFSLWHEASLHEKPAHCAGVALAHISMFGIGGLTEVPTWMFLVV